MKNPYATENWLRHDMESDWVWLPNGRDMSAPAAENHRDGWEEGKAEQAEIVKGLVEAVGFALKVFRPATTYAETEAIARLKEAIAKAKGE